MTQDAHRRRGQVTVEFAVLIAVVIAALIGMQIYLKRGVAGRLRQSADQIGEQFSATAINQYTENTTTSAIDSQRTDTTTAGGKLTQAYAKDKQTQSGTQTMGQVGNIGQNEKLF